MNSYSDHIPLFPPAFGEDKGEFFAHYDKIQDEIDDEMVNRLKENLDGLLVFAGLFAGINSAFLALTLTLMNPDPSDDIITLLQDLVDGLKAVALPSASFDASRISLVINALFALSLSSALFAAFFAVLGKQWLMLYRNRSGGGVDQQRWEQLRRSLGAERWGLVPVLEVVLPVLIQIALVIFAVGFVLYLRTMSSSLAMFVIIPLIVTTTILLVGAGVSLWDASCPFKTPLSELAHQIPTLAEALLHVFRRRRQSEIQSKRSHERKLEKEKAKQARRKAHGDRRETESNPMQELDASKAPNFVAPKDEEERVGQPTTPANSLITTAPARWKHLFNAIVSGRWRAKANSGTWRILDLISQLPGGRAAEEEEFLQIASIMRVVNISEHPPALYHAVLNLRAIQNVDLLQLICDDESSVRGLRECYMEALEDLACKSISRHQNPQLLRNALAFGTAFFHVSLSAHSFDEFLDMIGIEDAFLPLIEEEMTADAARVAGNSCRSAEAFVRNYINLQLRQLGTQPAALTSTTLAAVAFWYAINGIPHSQEVVYGQQLRESLVTSELSWSGVALLALINDPESKSVVEDTRKRKPYTIKELDGCRDAFLKVQKTYRVTDLTERLSKTILKGLTSSNNLEGQAILFQSAWRLFTREIDGPADNRVRWAQHALSGGAEVLCSIEEAIKSLKRKQKHSKSRMTRLEKARSICLKVMIDCMGPSDGELRTLKDTLWRKIIVLETVTVYLNYILQLDEPTKTDVKTSVEKHLGQIRQAYSQSRHSTIAMGKDYVSLRRNFEIAFKQVWPDAVHVSTPPAASAEIMGVESNIRDLLLRRR